LIHEKHEKTRNSFDRISPLGGFGGKGAGMWAFYLSGTEGVHITTNKKKSYLIGSDIPENLLKVIQAHNPNLLSKEEISKMI